MHISHGWKSHNASHKRIYKLLQLINSLDWSVNSIMQNFIGPCYQGFYLLYLKGKQTKIIVIQSIHQFVFNDQSTKFRLNELKDF